MTDLRTAAQQALELLYRSREHFGVYTEGDWFQLERDCHAAITALRAALAEDAMQKFSEVYQEIQAALAEDVVTHGSAWSKDGKRIDPMSVYTEPVQQALVEADRIMGHDDEATEWRERWAHLFGVAGIQVQEPVAWQWLDTAHFRKKIPADATLSHWRPLYTAPPQRKPLSEEELWSNDEIMSLNADFGWHMETIRMFARAIERAHGIKE